MDDRKAQLARAQPASLEWVWSTQLPLWLETGDDIFWISGKPASGKSTLIHYLSVDKHGSKQVLSHLQKHKKDCILVRFYFDFRAGHGIANTGLGMLRSLLLQLIDKSHLVKEYTLSRCKHRLDGHWPDLETELLDLICDAVSSTAVSVCGFVDSLDEYKGHRAELIGLLREVHGRSSIKLCLASRPEPELRYHLHKCPTFAMQDYNNGTITAYIEIATADIGTFVHVQQLRDILTDFVVRDANGVILWAVFAVDEAVKALLCGCTLTEVRKCLQSFPQELSSIYRRIWDSLAAKEQRLAAVMFFVIEKWDPSWHRTVGHVALSSRYLTVLTRSIVRNLDSSFVIEPDYTEINFRLKAHALLGGLIEGFGEANNVRLAHKSVQSFLHRLPVYLEWTDKICQVVDVDVLGPKTFVNATLPVCDALIPEPASFWGSVMRDLPKKPLLYLFLNYLTAHLEAPNRKTAVDCVAETIHRIWEYVAYAGSDGFDARRPSHIHVLDQSKLTPVLVSMLQTWLIKDYIIPFYLYTSKELSSVYFPRYVAFEALEQKSRATTLDQTRLETSNLLNIHPELLYLARFSLSHAFIAIIDMDGGLNRIDCDVLFSIILREWNMAPFDSPRAIEAQVRILAPILEQLTWPARFTAFLVFPALRLGLHASKCSEQCADLRLRPSLWWLSKEMDVIYLWIWMGEYKFTSQSDHCDSLDMLVDAGFSLEQDVFEEGNALHALFKFNPWSRQRLPDGLSNKNKPSAHPLDPLMYTARNECSHFSKSIFMALVAKGVDVHAPGLYGTVRQAAEKFLGSVIKVRDVSKSRFYGERVIKEVRETIAYIDSMSGSNITIRVLDTTNAVELSNNHGESQQQDQLRRTSTSQPLSDGKSEKR